MSTAPFTAAVADLVTASHRVDVSVTVTTAGQPTLTLPVIGGRLTWAETRAPRVTGDLVCPIPADASSLGTVFDPRLSVRVVVKVSYTLPSGSKDTQTVANLGLRRRSLNRPAGTVSLNLASDEALVIDRSPWANPGVDGGDGTEPATVTKDDGPGWIATMIESSVYPVNPTVVITAPRDPGQWPYGNPSDTWDAIQVMANELDIDVYDQGDRVFRIAPRRVTASTSSAVLRVGPRGTITDSEASITRDDWANFVALRHQWRTADGTEKLEYGTARVTSGPFNVNTVGYRNYVEQRSEPTTKAAATKAAAVILRRFLAHSHGYRVTAVAAWWLRPGQTVTVELPTTGQVRHIVAAVEFDIDSMSMVVTTRLPDTTSPIGE